MYVKLELHDKNSEALSVSLPQGRSERQICDLIRCLFAKTALQSTAEGNGAFLVFVSVFSLFV